MKELLVPVGNMESLKAAVLNGADAVYLGVKNLEQGHIQIILLMKKWLMPLSFVIYMG